MIVASVATGDAGPNLLVRGVMGILIFAGVAGAVFVSHRIRRKHRG